ncbi:hypothetical protein V8E51_019825 [Hyaloscypha variabilis]
MAALWFLSKGSYLEDIFLNERTTAWRKRFFHVRDNCLQESGSDSEVSELKDKMEDFVPKKDRVVSWRIERTIGTHVIGQRLRRMYGSAKGMLSTGITTFGDVLDGQEPQSLMEIFAFTCLSYTMSKLLQKHGRMEGSQVLADIDQWRLAIKKEKHRLVYDQAVKILWPEINFFKENSNEKGTDSIPPPTEQHLGSMVPLGQTFNGSTGPLYVRMPMLAYGSSSDLNFLEKARSAGCSTTENSMQSALQYPDSHLDPDNQLHNHGLHDHVMGLLQETSTHENIMFVDFLNFCDPQFENNIDADITSVKQPPDIAPATHPLDRPPQISPPSEPVSTLDPKKLGNSFPPLANSEVLDQTKLLASKADEVPIVPPLLGGLIETIMFQVAVEFMQFITSLGDLLFRLSGCGITSRHQKHEFEGYTRPVQEFGEFVAGAVNLVLEPIKEDLGEADVSVDVVLCMTDFFHLVCDYKSFTIIVSKTLKRCLAASNRMTWDHIYSSYAVDQEDYSTTYIKKTEATEIEWATQNFEKEDDGENNVNVTTTNDIQTVKPITTRHESSSSSNSDSLPSKKQKLSHPSPKFSDDCQSSTTPASGLGGDLPTPSKAHCHYSTCKKSYTGKDARINLRRHIRTVHEGCKAIKCPNCGHESSRRDNVRKHFLLKHKGEDMPAILMCKTRA